MTHMEKTLATLLLGVLPMAAQADSLRGTIKDKQTGEALVGATVRIEGAAGGTITDSEGNYLLTNLKSGTYRIVYSYIGYEKQTLAVTLHGEETRDVTLTPAEQSLGAATVTARAMKNNETAVNQEVKRAATVMNAVSAQQIKKGQDKDASEVVRRIPGISILEDKFVMVRGLSQRYNNVWLNKAAVPSSEADSRAFSFDIIPGSQLDNVMVVKSQAPEYPADFSGGFILINTKETSDSSSLAVSAGTGLNTQAAGRFLSAEKGSWDIGRRSFRPDYNIGLDFNKAWSPGGYKLSLLLAANHGDKRKVYKDMENNLFGTYDVYKDQSLYLRHAVDDQYSQELRTGGLLNLYLASPSGKHSYEWKNIYNRIETRRFTERDGISNAQGWKFAQGEYYFSTRNTCNTQFTGKHSVGDATRLDWSLGYAYADRSLPDRRIWMKTCDGPDEEIYLQTGNDITREWTSLKEHIFSAGANAGRTFRFGDFAPLLKFGAFAEYRTRRHDTRELVYTWDPLDSPLLPDGFRFLPVPEMMRHEGEKGLHTIDYTNRMNDYRGKNLIAAGYVGANLPFGKFNAYLGVRYEHTGMTLTLNQSRSEWMPVDHKYSYGDFFPSLNTTYRFSDAHQVRASYGRSVNRPEFRELSPSVFYDFDLGSEVKGNSGLKPCHIDNFDLRYEWYPSRGEQVSVALFYKHFRDPIEWVYTVTGGTDLCYSFQNADAARSYGIEIDARKSLDFVGLPLLSLNANVAFIHSRVSFRDKSQQKERQMQGQSPYIVNLGLFYESPRRKVNLGVLYNRIGKRLVGVGRNANASEQSADVPDSYEMPRNVVDLSASWKCLKALEVKLSVRDLLNERVTFKQTTDVVLTDGSRREKEEVTKRYRPGTSIQISASYTF